MEFYAGPTKLGEDTSAPFNYTWVGAPTGSHTLTAVAVDDVNASATSSAVAITVAAISVGGQTAVLQDGLNGYAGTRDAFFYEGFLTSNFGSNASLVDQQASGTKRRRSLLKFSIFNSDGGPVPDGATITSASLSLYKYSYYNFTYRLRALLSAWVENEVTWSQSRLGVPWAGPGATAIGTDLALAHDADGATVWNPGWVTFDVTNGVQAMASGRPNHGWALEGVSGNNNLKEFRSSEYTDVSLRPKLVIVYSVTAPNVPPTVALTAPANGASFALGTPVALVATASDADGTVSRVEFYAGPTKLGEDTSAPFNYTWVGAPTGSHTLTAVAVDDVNARATSSAVAITVAAISGGGQTAVLQDGLNGYAGTRDAFFYEGFLTSNFGSNASLVDQQASGTKRRRSLVKFSIFNSDGGPVPDGATITSASLSLYKYSYYNFTYRVRALLSAWVENEVTWSQSRLGVPWAGPGATAIGTDLALAHDADGAAGWNPGWVTFDVTHGVQAMASGRPNHGWALEGVSGNNNLKEFRSSEYTDVSLRPKLVVVYSTP